MNGRRFGIVSFVSLAGAIACTYDYDRYEPTEGSSPSGSDASTSDVQTSSDSGSGGTTDSQSPDTGPTCGDKGSCATTAKTCTDGCATKLGACESQCTGGGAAEKKCKDDCTATSTSCTKDCKSTCQSCAGTACASVCP